MRQRFWLLGIILSGLCLGLNAQVSRMESEYLRLFDGFEQRRNNTAGELKKYLDTYPYTTYESEVRMMLGVLEIEHGSYKKGVRDLDFVQPDALTRPHQDVFRFYRGYGYLMLQDFKHAEPYFSELRDYPNGYRERAFYYHAYCLYKQNRYDEAMPLLLALEYNSNFRQTVPYYITQIYYKQHNLNEARARAEQLLHEQPANENNYELCGILGECYYADGDYTHAGEMLTRYMDGCQKLKRPIRAYDLYLLANIQVQQGQIAEAKLGYQAALDAGLPDDLQEEAQYNYTLCCYQQSTALGESIRAFTDFLQQYPRSRHKDDIQRLLCDAFIRSGSYQSALDALDQVRPVDAKVLATRQYLRYNLGTDAFVQNNMKQAEEWFTQVITHAEPNDPYLTEAYYWRAETRYRMHDNLTAQSDINLYLNRHDVASSPNHHQAIFLNAYIDFNNKQYDSALGSFLRYSEMVGTGDPTWADARCRIADCQFMARRYTEAIQSYTEVLNHQGVRSDYALFQIGCAQGLTHHYADKVETMRRLVRQYPKSDYTDDALYEEARALIEDHREGEAISTYSHLLDNYPNSRFARMASIEKAMLYRNLGQKEQAIEAYKQTIQSYPGSEQAYVALEGLEALYVELNRISDYMAYTKELGRYRMNITTREDSLTHAAAEVQYMLGNYPAALVEYTKLCQIEGNPYMEEACMRVGELSYDSHDYETALEYFGRMLAVASGRENTHIARLGILRSSYNLHRNESTIEIADLILGDEPIPDEVRQEALYNRAKAYMAIGKYGQALVDWDHLKVDVRTAEGAEALYSTAECYYHMGATESAERVIMDLLGRQTSQQYWLARALILLSDIYFDRGDTFESQQYLLTLQRNYNTPDEIPSLVAEKLKRYEEEQYAE